MSGKNIFFICIIVFAVLGLVISFDIAKKGEKKVEGNHNMQISDLYLRIDSLEKDVAANNQLRYAIKAIATRSIEKHKAGEFAVWDNEKIIELLIAGSNIILKEEK